MDLKKLSTKIIDDNYLVNRQEALELASCDLDLLGKSAKDITQAFFNNKIELCAISNGKCGRCSEDCKFCAQSRHFKTEIEPTPLKDNETLFKEAKYNAERGVHRFSVVTAGALLSKRELENLALGYQEISSKLNIKCCGSLGLLSYADFLMLKEHGMTRVHNNIETSRRFFPQICTTHSFEQKIKCIEDAKKAGLEVCSGCIIGMGETLEDRIDIALELQKLDVVSCPINILNPIKGTPLENAKPLSLDEIKLTISLFRHILPKVVLRLAGGRIKIKDDFSSLYDFGINAMISGDMLTTAGLSIASDHSAIIASQHQASLIE
ncbi:MAG: biotin synthase BioB [Succinatimonas sp.]|nr:biotin synthase BioB [Succinatimonas sp.]